MVNNPHYLHRMTVLRAISLLAPVMGSEITCSKLLPVVVTVSKDRSIREYTSSSISCFSCISLLIYNLCFVLSECPISNSMSQRSCNR